MQPLSFNQDLIVLMCESAAHGSHGDVACQNAVAYGEVTGEIDAAALRAAMAAVAQRHEMLRTSFAVDGGTWGQRVAPETPVALEIVDLVETHPDAADARDAFERAAAALQFRRFDLATPPLWSMHVFRVDSAHHLFVIVLSHLIADARGAQIVLAELDVEYRRAVGRPAPALAPAVQYGEHAEGQRAALDRFVHGGSNVQEWREVVEYGKVARFGLRQAARFVPMTLAPGRARATEMQAVDVPVEAELLARLRTTARHAGVTVNIVCLAAFHLALQRWTGLGRLSVWSDKSTRKTAFADVVGTFADATMFITDVDPAAPVADLLADLDRQQQMFLRSDGLMVAGLRAGEAGLAAATPLLASSQRVLYQFFAEGGSVADDVVLRPAVVGQPHDILGASLDLHCCVISTRRSMRVRLRWDVGVFDGDRVHELVRDFLSALAEVADRAQAERDGLVLVAAGASR